MENKYYRFWIKSFLSYCDDNISTRQKKDITFYVNKAKNYYKIANNRLIKSKNENN